jgi:hypothetical protein
MRFVGSDDRGVTRGQSVLGLAVVDDEGACQNDIDLGRAVVAVEV